MCDLDRRHLLVLNLIWLHSNAYSWLLGLRVARRGVANVAIECSKDAFGCASIFLVRYDLTRMWYLDIFCCAGSMWVGLRAAVGCCTAFLSLCPYPVFFKFGNGPKVFTLTHHVRKSTVCACEHESLSLDLGSLAPGPEVMFEFAASTVF